MLETNQKPKIHAFVCINERVNSNMPSCSPTITKDYVKEVKLWIRKQGWTGMVVCTKVKCLGFCNSEGGVMCIFPSARYFKGVLSVDEIKRIIKEEVES
tara:strand:- start:985 stop:1281 length:297 start_codon:yes stop_codon:yes gene_type:complete